jgi:predicted ATPase/class 3 adenylate cyclase/Tfp pilus assembly protein PilF
MCRALTMMNRTFLFTDIEGSTMLWERFPDRMKSALARHDTILRAAIENHGGRVFKTVGDSFCCVFPAPLDAILAAVAAQHEIAAEQWTGLAEPIRVRIAIHTGPAEARDSDYFGQTLNRVSRIMAAGHGGQILISESAAALLSDVLPQSGRLVDLGEHRLRDLINPEHIFQYCESGLQDEFPLIRSLSAFAHNLPEQLTSFIGREPELAEIRYLLARGRLLTLTGSGGSGKTRLALQAAAEAMDGFANGVWFVDVATVVDGDMLPGAVASDLHLRKQAGLTVLETLAAFLRDKRMLLILDNCEHIVSACAELANMLLKSCPELHILTTSRERLGVAGEITWRVPSLPLPTNQDLNCLEKVAENPAVCLFVDRAVSVVPSFRLTVKNAVAIVGICRRLDGIPLAIELAAARVKTISPEEIALRLGDRFRFLTGGSRTALPRHQTLRAAIDWSYHLLGGLEGILFRRLSLFCGSFSLEAAESICGDADLHVGEILDSLATLVDKSLLLLEHSDGAGRYRMLETIREYASERLREANELAATQSQFIAYFLEIGQRAGPELSGPAQGEWLERLDAEHENILAALAWNAQDADLATGQVRLAVALSRFWLVRGHWEEGLTCMLRVLAIQIAAPPAAERAKGFNSCGNLACQLGKMDAALQYYQRSLEIRRESGDERGVAATLNNLGMVRRRQGQDAEAKDLFAEALLLFRRLGHESGAATCLNNLASLLSAQGQHAEAEVNIQEALHVFRVSGDQLGVAAGLVELGNIALSRHDIDRAELYFEESLAISRALGEKIGIVDCLQHLGQVMIVKRDYERARILYEESLNLAKELAASDNMAAAREALKQLEDCAVTS